MTADLNATSSIHAQCEWLCEGLDSLQGPMCAAFSARMWALQDVLVKPVRLPTDDAWWQAWFDKLVTLLRAELDDPMCVALAVGIARWGQASGVDETTQRLAMEALGWACRDVLPERTPPAVLAAMEVRAALLQRVWPRVARGTKAGAERE
jgi:hypothetical protein